MAGYPINVGAMMSTNITLAVQKDKRSYPYPNFLTENFNDQKVEPRQYDTKSEEPTIVVIDSAAEPSTVAGPSTGTTDMPPSSSSRPSSPLSVPASSTYPLTVLRSSTQAAPQVKKMQKSQALKKSVDKLTTTVTKFASARDLPLDLLMETAPAVPTARAAPAVPEAPEAATGQSEEPVATAHTAEEIIQMLSNPVVPLQGDDEIQLEETEGAEDAMQAETT
uniref:Uncharacterized protein n=1 Tax=Nicotiana tabacum TaxID=4097 RepID=A0A1S4BH02_TOBAC|nr:PREDICTED: uncharacterized protein LOC107808177 [Nicotiana tabacum]